MPPARRGVALVVALLIVLVLAGLGGSALATAHLALGRSADDLRQLRHELARDAVRARVAARAASVSADAWRRAPWPVGPPDTVITVQDLGGGWYRWTAQVGSRVAVAELARAARWVGPCAAVVTAGHVPADVLTADPADPCADAVLLQSESAVDSLVAAWSSDLVPAVAPETLVVEATAAQQVFRATGRAVVPSGAAVEGIIIAPVVHLGVGAVVRGLVVARDGVEREAGSRVIGASLSAAAAWGASARLHLLGRRGLLAPP